MKVGNEVKTTAGVSGENVGHRPRLKFWEWGTDETVLGIGSQGEASGCWEILLSQGGWGEVWEAVMQSAYCRSQGGVWGAENQDGSEGSWEPRLKLGKMGARMEVGKPRAKVETGEARKSEQLEAKVTVGKGRIRVKVRKARSQGKEWASWELG